VSSSTQAKTLTDIVVSKELLEQVRKEQRDIQELRDEAHNLRMEHEVTESQKQKVRSRIQEAC
jgi:hypothetical protein